MQPQALTGRLIWEIGTHAKPRIAVLDGLLRWQDKPDVTLKLNHQPPPPPLLFISQAIQRWKKYQIFTAQTKKR